MSNDNSDSPGMQTSLLSDAEIAQRVARWSDQRAELATLITPDMNYARLTWNLLNNIGDPDLIHRYMMDKECAVAQKILDWLNERPNSTYDRDAIKAIPYLSHSPSDKTRQLVAIFWESTHARTWISAYDAPSPDSLLWQFALIRLSCFLHTGNWALNMYVVKPL